MSIWNEIRSTIAGELSDLPDVAGITRVCMRLLTAALLGGLIGLERERRRKSAGIRTHILVGMGSALFLLVPREMHLSDDAITRVIQGLLAGIGFLGAGAIVKNGDSHHPADRHGSTSVQGLTTAASIWMTAAIGMTVGLGRELTAILSTVFALIVLALLPRVEHKDHVVE